MSRFPSRALHSLTCLAVLGTALSTAQGALPSPSAGSATGCSAGGWTTESNETGAYYGSSVSAAGDVNGDGYPDLIVGAREYSNGVERVGRAYVFHGSANGLDYTPGWTTESDQDLSWYGFSVSGAGDVNGDGYADVIVGAPEYEGLYQGEGRVYVYHGGANGLGAAPSWYQDAPVDPARFGCSVSSAGDVNGDGYSDVVIGANQFDNGVTGGIAVVYHGSSSGLEPTPAWTGRINQYNAHYGTSVSTAGDVNGDGYSDVIAGAPDYGGGRAYVYHGSPNGLVELPAWSALPTFLEVGGQDFGASVASAGDVNGDGYADVVIGAPNASPTYGSEGTAYVYHGGPGGLENDYAWVGQGGQKGASFGNAVSSAGDVNGDGFSEIVVGARLHTSNPFASTSGRVYVFYGSRTGTWTRYAWSADSPRRSSYLGTSVSAAGDVNGDGWSDVAAGAPSYSNPEGAEGRAFVYHGSSTGAARPVASAVERNGGTNLRALYTDSPPVLGLTWSVTVNITGTAAVRGYSQGGIAAPLPGGQTVLVGGDLILELPPKTGYGPTWTVQVPPNPSLCGATLFTQAAVFGGSSFTLTNALDLVVGF